MYLYCTLYLPRDMGAVPAAIAWLYRAVKERKSRTGARFSIRASALEITSQREEIRQEEQFMKSAMNLEAQI